MIGLCPVRVGGGRPGSIGGVLPVDEGDGFGQRRAVNACERAGDIEGVLAVLAPDVVRRADREALMPGRPGEVRGARKVAEEIVAFGCAALSAQVALVDGRAGLAVAPGGRLRLAVLVTIADGLIAGYELVAVPQLLQQGSVAVLDVQGLHD